MYSIYSDEDICKFLCTFLLRILLLVPLSKCVESWNLTNPSKAMDGYLLIHDKVLPFNKITSDVQTNWMTELIYWVYIH